MKNKICYTSRSAIHYRKEIYLLMDKELDVDFYFGDSRPGAIEKFDVGLMKHFKKYLHNINIGPFYWQQGLLRLLFSDYKYVISTCDTYCLNSWLFIALAPLFGKRVLWWTHGAYGNEGFLKKIITKAKICCLHGVLLYGEYAKDILIKYGVNPNKLHVIYNSLSYDEQMVVRKNLDESGIYSAHFKNNSYNIVFTGRLTKVKKLHQILEAIAKLKDKGINFNVTFVGDGVEKNNLIEISDRLALKSNVWFYGACYDEMKLSTLIYNADLCVSPGNVGLTAMHAMTFGTPVISHDNFPMQMPEFEAIEEGKTGAFFKEDDVESLVAAVESWVNHGYNREDVRKACYSVIDTKYNPHKQVELLKSVIK